MITVRTGLVICDAPTRRCKKSRYEYSLLSLPTLLLQTHRPLQTANPGIECMVESPRCVYNPIRNFRSSL